MTQLNGGKRPAHGAGIERAVDVDGTGHVVGDIVRVALLQHPEPCFSRTCGPRLRRIARYD